MKLFKKIYNVATSIFLIFAFILVFLLVGLRLFGFDPYTVLSGSMEPKYHVGSMVYVKEINTDSIAEGDPLTYYSANGSVVTHRVIEVIEEGGQRRFRTKGDANNIPDGGSVGALQVIGKPVFSIPYLGYVTVFIQSKSGMYLASSISLFMLIGLIVPEIVKHFSRRKIVESETAEQSECVEEDRGDNEQV